MFIYILPLYITCPKLVYKTSKHCKQVKFNTEKNSKNKIKTEAAVYIIKGSIKELTGQLKPLIKSFSKEGNLGIFLKNNQIYTQAIQMSPQEKGSDVGGTQN